MVNPTSYRRHKWYHWCHITDVSVCYRNDSKYSTVTTPSNNLKRTEGRTSAAGRTVRDSEIYTM